MVIFDVFSERRFEEIGVGAPAPDLSKSDAAVSFLSGYFAVAGKKGEEERGAGRRGRLDCSLSVTK